MKYLYSIGVCFSVLVVLSVTSPLCAVEKGKTLIGKTRAAANITGITIQAEVGASVTIEKTKDLVGVESTAPRGKAENAVTLEQQGTALVIRIKAGKAEVPDKENLLKSHLRIFVPEGRDLFIFGDNVVVSGDISAKNLSIKAQSVSLHALKIAAAQGVSVSAKYAELKFTLTGAKKLTLAVDQLSGKITVPASTEVVCPEKEGLQIIRAGREAK